ncbi:hypothetical protein GCM10010472_00720 [Pseudonocardia halophobica]|uniref:Ribbon-helix-helix protein CopG domain-containing protein n=1 Tax=Pseudonocardia halophobica TaxID=29401 RepID=A0A9W6NUU3_9PSEU|nr:ribbon-helix-helix protein, CopG family [Pseudonocardia halophobica]GLL10169.1 hypothetical protein GCM10017577_13090 [Pseudonocardia halophobica]
MHRTQVLLEDEQYLRLREESARTGRSIGDLVRDAVEKRYGTSRAALRAALDGAFGAADEGDFDDLAGEEYVDRARGAWADRDARLGWTR